MNHECQGVPKVLHLYQSRHTPLMSRASQITYPVLTDEPIKAHREPGMSLFRTHMLERSDVATSNLSATQGKLINPLIPHASILIPTMANFNFKGIFNLINYTTKPNL